MKKIVLTGGGTAGHVTPNLALLPALREQGFDIRYIGSYAGIERGLIEEAGLVYDGISTGKLRRYFDLKNFTDPFRVLRGFFEARRVLKEYRPNVVFSKGGFVSVPVVLAAKTLGIPAIIHESDLTPGLANKICIPAAARVCCNFPETLPFLPKEKAILTGSPIRRELLAGDRKTGLAYAGLTGEKPVVLVIGGSLGAVAVNRAVRSALPLLLTEFQVIHICGAGHLDGTLAGAPGYVQYEFVREPLADLFAAADLVISRAGANSICEILALHKPNVLIPLPASASRGDQLLNARSFEKQGFSAVLEEEALSDSVLMETVLRTYENRSQYVEAMKNSPHHDAITQIMELILAVS